MNPVRILIISNRYLLCVGFTVNKFSKKFKIYQRSILGTVIFALLNILYLLCLHEHYDQKAMLENLKDFSKTLYYAIYTHLFLGIASVCVILFDKNAFSTFSNQIVSALPKNGECRTRLDRAEMFVYYRTFVNLIVLFGMLAYDLTIIDLKSLTRSRVMLVIVSSAVTPLFLKPFKSIYAQRRRNNRRKEMILNETRNFVSTVANALYYPHCAIANCFRYFTIKMAILRHTCQNLNKELSDIELAHQFRQHGLYFEYLKSENIVEENELPSTNIATWSGSHTVSSINSTYEKMKIQDSAFFRKWWEMNPNRRHSPRKTDVILMLEVVKSDDFLMLKLKKIFEEYDKFMKMYRKLEALIQKQLFLAVCHHSVVVLFTIHLFFEIYLEWGDLLDEHNIQVIKVNYTIHLIQIFHDFGCMALVVIICRNEIRITKTITTKLMAMPFCDNVRCVVSYFYFKLQSFKENVYAFNLFKMDGCSYFMIILQYAIISCIYALYQYFDIKFYNLQSTVDAMNEDDE